MRQGEEVLARALASGELRLVESRRPDGTADWVVWTRSELRGALRRHECPGDHDGGSAMTPMGGVGGDARLATSSGYRRKRGEGPPSRAAPGLPGALLVGPGPRGAGWHHLGDGAPGAGRGGGAVRTAALEAARPSPEALALVDGHREALARGEGA